MSEMNVPCSANASTSPPNCAICLGPCTNKCFSDSCMHQFCFRCLLEWSKVKAVCPLCKQPFTSIIHNVKSNNEYDEHFIETEDVQQVLEENDFLYLPSAPPSRHFQFRTTFTVDPRGELAIQQMLLTHPLTNSVYMPDYNYSSHRFGRYRRRDTSSTIFRRSIYAQNLWVTAQPDITGRYRDVSPNFYRENPAARNRLVPWLNRELNALLEENTQQVMHLVDIILGHLYHHQIRGRFFKNLLREFLGNRTDHFIHEFYSFMRSPFDMIGYDRHVFYSPRSPYIQTISGEDDSDSDITVIGLSETNTNLFHRPTIEVIEINSDSSRDSDVIIHEPSPPVVIDLLDSDSDNNVINLSTNSAADNNNSLHSDNEKSSKSTDVSKRECSKKKLREKYSKIRKRVPSRQKSSKYAFSTSNSDNTTSTSESSDEVNYKYLKRKRKQRLKRSSRSKLLRKMSDSSDDSEPLIETLRKVKDSSNHKLKHRKKEKNRKFLKYLSGSDDSASTSKSVETNDFRAKTTQSRKYATVNTDVPFSFHSSLSDGVQVCKDLVPLGSIKCSAEIDNYQNIDVDYFAGPSNAKLTSEIKKEKSMWYSRPCVYDSESSME